MWEYNESAICKLLKLVALNYKKDEEFIGLIEDALCLRVATCLKEKIPVNIDKKSFKNLVEGMNLLSRSRKPLNDVLKRLLIEQDTNKDNFINIDFQLCLSVVKLIGDYDIQVSQKLKEILNAAIVDSHVKPGHFSLNDLSYIALCQDLLTEENRVILKEAIENGLPVAPEITQEEMERFVLAYPDELSLISAMTQETLGKIQDNSNLVELLVEMVNKATQATPIEFHVNSITCGGKVKASILFDDRHIIEIVENELVHYKKPNSTEWSLRKRGRLAEQLVQKKKSKTSYSIVSYVELEQAEDEREILNLALKPLIELQN